MNWWSAWGQSATAIGGFVLGAVGFALGIYNSLMARREHGWKVKERESREARAAWCQKMAAELRNLPAGRGGVMPVPDEHREDAKWGEVQGYFLTYLTDDGTLCVRRGPR